VFPNFPALKSAFTGRAVLAIAGSLQDIQAAAQPFFTEYLSSIEMKTAMSWIRKKSPPAETIHQRPVVRWLTALCMTRAFLAIGGLIKRQTSDS